MNFLYIQPSLPLIFISICFAGLQNCHRKNFLHRSICDPRHLIVVSPQTGVAAKAMRNELSGLVNSVDDPAQKKVSNHIAPSKVLAFTLCTLRCVPRASTPRCNPFSICLLDISPTAPKVKSCEHTRVCTD